MIPTNEPIKIPMKTKTAPNKIPNPIPELKSPKYWLMSDKLILVFLSVSNAGEE